MQLTCWARAESLNPRNDGRRKYIVQETVICSNPHNSPNRDSSITRHLGYKHKFCKNFVSKKRNCLSLYFCKKITSLIVGLIRSQVFSDSCKLICGWGRKDSCFISDTGCVKTHDLLLLHDLGLLTNVGPHLLGASFVTSRIYAQF